MSFSVFVNGQTLYINEFLASNDNGLTDDFGENDDWVEIYNPGAVAVDIGGMYVTDDLTEPTQWQIPTTDPATTTIPPGGFIILWFDKNTDQGPLHVDAKLGAGGEDIGLYASDGVTAIDTYTFGPQLTDVSEGRVPDGGAVWDFYLTPTPGGPNNTTPGLGNTETPVPSLMSGLYSGEISVAFTSATPDATIYFTTDGSDPNDESMLYTEPIPFDTTTILRAIAYSLTLSPSDVATESYLIDVSHDFAIVTINTDPDNLFDEDDGLYVNYEEEIEKPAHVQFYEPNGTLAFSQDVEIELHGNASVSLPQKSFKIKAKKSLGAEYFDYPIFPDLPYEKYRSFIVRQSAQDWNKTMFRDAMSANLFFDLEDLNGIVKRPDLDLQGYRPGIVYLNGQYWGIYNVREQMNWKYLDVHYGVDDEEVDVVEDRNELEDGDLMNWDALFDFLENNTFEGEENYNQLAEKIEIKNFIDNRLMGIILDNNDWPGNNNKHWRERTPDGKWRWIAKDLDFGFGLRPINADWNSGDFTTDMVGICLDDDSQEYYNRPWSTLILRRLMENETSRNYFINRAADQLNTIFSKQRVLDRIDQFETTYTPEMQQHFDRWQSGWNGHADNVEKLRTFANGRTDAMRDHIIDNFDEVDETVEVTLNANPSNGGDLEFSTIQLSETSYPWTGLYFDGVPVPVKAYPNRGYLLDSWSLSDLGDEVETTITLDDDTDLTANFILGSTATDPIVINEINYNSPDFPDPADWVELYNPNTTAVDISGWYFQDESDDFFGMPAGTILPAGGYLVLAEDVFEFKNVYGSITDVIGDFGADPRGFGLSGKGELVQLFNAAGVLIDEVEYDDKAPWPTEPDGDGPTLQLISADLDNALAESWISFPATPAAQNGVVPPVQDQVIDFPELEDKLTFDLPFDISATATSGLPVSFSVISGPATINDNTVTLDGVTGLVTIRASQAGNASFFPATNIDRTFLVTTFSGGGPTGYCESEGSAPWSEWISNVEIASIDHGSERDKYADYTTQATYVNQGETYPLILTPSYSSSPKDEYWNVWIDYNQDSDFDDAGELVFSINATGEVTGNVTIPQDALLGPTRMRVSMNRDFSTGPCDLFDRGEVEDYTLIIQTGAPELTVNCPNNINLSTAPGGTTAIANWSVPTATTSCSEGSDISIVQTTGPASGSSFSIGTTTIVYEIADLCGVMETCSFDVIVSATPATLNLSCPSDITVEIPFGSTGTTVVWNAPVVSSDCVNGGASSTQTAGPTSGSTFEIGTTTIAYEAMDNCGNMASCSFLVTVVYEATTLTTTCPEPITVTAPTGAPSVVVNWDEPTGISDCPIGAVSITQIEGPANGSTLPINTTYVVSYEITDGCGNTETCIFDIVISGEPATLTVNCPDDITIVADPGATSTIVNWTPPTATSDCGIGAVSINQIAGPANGSTFNIGTTIISYQIEDGCGNSELCSFSITVDPFIAILSLDCSQNITVNTLPGASSVAVTWTGLSVSTTCPVGVPVLTQTSGPINGSNFNIGTTTISYGATDNCGNVESCSFDVTVVGIPATLNLSCPENIVATTTGGSAIVTWDAPIASSDCSTGGAVISQTGGLPSGSEFALGVSTISYQAEDACGNLETCSFTVTVQAASNTITLNCPADLSFSIPFGANSTTVNWSLPSGTTTCNGGSGSTNCGVGSLTGFTAMGSFEGNEYYLHNEKVKWEDARDICESLDGHLAIVTSEAENQYIFDNVSDVVHIGLTDESTEGVFEWVDGTALAGGYNNLNNSNTEAKDYATLQPWNGEWGMINALTYKKFVLELECNGGSSLDIEQIGGPANGSDLAAGTYTITYQAMDDCGGLQTCSFEIEVLEAPALLELSCPFNITVTAPVGAAGTAVTWPEPTVTTTCVPSNIMLGQIQGLPNGSIFPLGISTIVYEAADECGNIETCEFDINVQPEQVVEGYCESQGNQPWQQWISNVTIENINNSSGKNKYGDFTNQSTNLILGGTHTLSVTPGFSWSQPEVYIKAWIDFNQDEDFSDAGEEVYASIRPSGSGGTTVDPVSENINIPITANAGPTRMRVAMKVDAFAGPCEEFDLGEVEDYTVNITPVTIAGNQNNGNQSKPIDDFNFDAYPNPANGELFIKMAATDQLVTMEIYDLLGKRLMSQELAGGIEEPVRLDVSNLQNGIYILNVNWNGEAQKSQRILIGRGKTTTGF